MRRARCLRKPHRLDFLTIISYIVTLIISSVGEARCFKLGLRRVDELEARYFKRSASIAVAMTTERHFQMRHYNYRAAFEWLVFLRIFFKFLRLNR